MTKDKLSLLYDLISEWIAEPEWNKHSAAWANIVETRRQVLIDLRIEEPHRDKYRAIA